jgi:hypothetical protein
MIERPRLDGRRPQSKQKKSVGLLEDNYESKMAPKKKKKKKKDVQHPDDVAYGKALQAKWANKRGNP